MTPIKTLINAILFSLTLLFVGCLNSTKKEEVVGSPEVVNRLIAKNITPADVPSKTQSIITLSYESIDSDLASSCSLSQLSHVSVTQACSCDQLGVCTVGVTGAAAYTGAASFNYNVVAGGKTSTTGKASFSISAPPAGSNEAPTISPISAKTTTEGIAISNIAFTVADTDSTVSCSNVTVASSNTTLIPSANVVVSGSGTSCSVTVTPAANQIGSSNITLTLTDTGSPFPAKTAVSTFTVTVNAFNDPPTISTISPQITNEDTPTSAIAFTIADVDSTLACSNVTATSSNTSLVSVSNIVIGGTAPNCTVTLSPSLNQSGVVTITLTVRDNGTPLPAKTASTSFGLTVVSVNDAPVIAAIATQVTNESTAKSVNFTITDVDSNLTCNGSTVITSSNTALVPNTNISITGIAPNCTATITPVSGQSGTTTLTVAVSDNGFPMPIQTTTTTFNLQVMKVNQAPTISAITNQTTNEDTVTSAINFTIADSDSTVYCSNVVGTSSNTALVANANIVISGTAPNCQVVITPASNGYGSATITLTLTDNGTPMPALTATSIFTLTVNAVNDAPTLSAIATQTTGQATASSPIAFTINDVDSSLSCTSSVAATSSNTTLIPNANIVISGTAPNCQAVITPATGYGSVTITLTLTDNGTPMPALTATQTFTMNVTQVNQAPVISSITAQSTNEDTAINGIAFTITDADSTVYCNNVAGTSSNTALVPNANIVITGTAPNCVAAITPTANNSGSAMITLTLTDNGVPLPAKTATSAFTLTVNAVNDAPTISAITNKSTDEDTPTSAITFTIADIDSTLTCSGNVAGTSSNTSLVPNANIVISGTAPNCQAVITPPATASGSATITLTVSDNGTPMPAMTATSVFGLTVAPVPDISGSLTVASNLSGIASSYSGNSYARTINFTGLTADEALNSVEVCLGTAAGSCDVSSWVEATGYTTSGSAPSVSLGGSYKLKSGVGGAQTFTIYPSCSSTNNYYYSVRGTSATSKLSNVVSTPAWTFWEPSCLGSTVLAQWLDVTETATMTFVSTAISQINDKSGNGRNMTQATANKRPAYSASSMGTNLPGITFNGTQSVTNGSSLAGTKFVYDLGASSIFTVMKAAAINANRYIYSEGNTGTTSNVSYSPFVTSTTNTITSLQVNSGNVTEVNLPTTSTTFFNNTIMLGMMEDSGTTFYSYTNGTSQSQAKTNYTRAGSTLTTSRIGARFRNNAETGWMAGVMGEFIVTNGVLSTLNRQKLEGYAAHKWGVSANLPAGHPYKTTPP